MINDKIQREYLNDVKFPEIHGHVEVKLYEAKSGNLAQVIEGDNIVSNAVKDIFANNVVGGINYDTITPLFQTWFGGILCYANAHATDGNGDIDPDNYFPQDDGNNRLIAHAGNTAPSDMADDRRRGSPNSAAYSYGSNTVTLGWEWGSTQGNCNPGEKIYSLSLTHKDTGNVGLGSASQAFANFTPIERVNGGYGDYANHLSAITPIQFIDDIVAKYDDENGLAFYIGASGRYGTGTSSERYRFETNQITVNIRPFAFKKVGLFNTTKSVKSITDAQSTYPIQREFTVTIPFNCYCQPAYHFDYSNKHLWIFSNITDTEMAFSQTVNYCEIDCTPSAATRVVSNGTFTTTGTSLLAPVCRDRTGVVYSRVEQPNIAKIGDYVYVPTTTNASFGNDSYVNGFRKIKITNIGQDPDQSNVTFNTAQMRLRSTLVGGDLLIYGGRVVNNGIGYSCQDPVYSATGATDTYAFTQPYSISCYAPPIAPSGDTAKARYILANKLVNTTLFNLPTAAEKTNTRSMTITYTLTYSS